MAVNRGNCGSIVKEGKVKPMWSLSEEQGSGFLKSTKCTSEVRWAWQFITKRISNVSVND